MSIHDHNDHNDVIKVNPFPEFQCIECSLRRT